MSNRGGFRAFLSAVLWVYRGLASDMADTVLVWWGLKRRPATGKARWIWDRPEPDPQATAWLKEIRDGERVQGVAREAQVLSGTARSPGQPDVEPDQDR